MPTTSSCSLAASPDRSYRGACPSGPSQSTPAPRPGKGIIGEQSRDHRHSQVRRHRCRNENPRTPAETGSVRSGRARGLDGRGDGRRRSSPPHDGDHRRHDHGATRTVRRPDCAVTRSWAPVYGYLLATSAPPGHRRLGILLAARHRSIGRPVCSIRGVRACPGSGRSLNRRS